MVWNMKSNNLYLQLLLKIKLYLYEERFGHIETYVLFLLTKYT